MRNLINIIKEIKSHGENCPNELYKEFYDVSMRTKINAEDRQMTANYNGVPVTLHYEIEKGYKSNNYDVPNDPTNIIPISLYIEDIDITDLCDNDTFETISEHIIEENY